MGRKPAPEPLSLEELRLDDDSRPTDAVSRSSARLPPDTASPRSPRSPYRHGQNKVDTPAAPLVDSSQTQPLADILLDTSDDLRQRQRSDDRRDPPQPSPRDRPAEQQPLPPQQPPALAPPQPQTQQQPSQPYPGHKHTRREDKSSKSGFFFGFGKSQKSSDRSGAHQHSNSRTETMSRDADRPGLSKQSSKSDSSQQDQSLQKPVTPLPSRSDVSLASTAENESSPGNTSVTSSKKSKPKPFHLLGRTKSFKDKDGDSPSPNETAPVPAPTPGKNSDAEVVYGPQAPPKTAPIQSRDRSFREMMSSAVRNHSAERSHSREKESRGRDHDGHHYKPPIPSYPQTPGGAFFSNLKNSRAAGVIRDRLFGGSKSEPPPPKEPVVDDEHYQLKVINLPLVEQTRLTRISKRLEDSRDKTEFWMPAFPWRAIDYLNYKGSEVEGLYRVPGSGPQIKKWQRRFDEELDVDLFEQDDLYDINIIGSMLKAWLRELPDELFPKEAQERIARECAGAEKVPDLLVEELSNLPPFNYYLLFAITCHLSLLLAHSDKNKMDFRNLCICFQPCMKIDAFCFKFLVCDWRDCWKGCKNEAKYIEEEYALFDQPPPRIASRDRSNGTASRAAEEDRREDQKQQQQQQSQQQQRNVSSSSESSNSKSSSQGQGSGQQPQQQQQQQQKPIKKKRVPTGADSEGGETGSTIPATLTIDSSRDTPPRKTAAGELRPLSPIKPLSPLNL